MATFYSGKSAIFKCHAFCFYCILTVMFHWPHSDYILTTLWWYWRQKSSFAMWFAFQSDFHIFLPLWLDVYIAPFLSKLAIIAGSSRVSYLTDLTLLRLTKPKEANITILFSLLPPASEGWQKVIFSLCPAGGVLPSSPDTGYPHPAQMGRGDYPYPVQWQGTPSSSEGSTLASTAYHPLQIRTGWGYPLAGQHGITPCPRDTEQQSEYLLHDGR